MKTSIKIFFTLLFLGLVQHASASQVVIGQITDKSSNDPMPGVNVIVKGSINGTISDLNGNYTITVQKPTDELVFSFVGYISQTKKVGTQTIIDIALIQDVSTLDEIVVGSSGYQKKMKATGAVERSMGMPSAEQAYSSYYSDEEVVENWNTEEYDHIQENTFKSANLNPLSTFSIDVDGASYSNMRRMLNYGQIPQKDVVRIEEMINYFDYDYPQPAGANPFSVYKELSTAPWNPNHYLVHIGIQGQKMVENDQKGSNLVFLIDVSGSMSDANKLPLLISSMKLLVNSLNESDRVAIVTYAGASGLVLPSTPVSQKGAIISALDRLNAGGSTAGGEGIELAYKVAQNYFVDGGNNRIILATDGDFNIGTSSTGALVEMIEEKRKSGIFLTIVGFGMGNYKDNRMEQISNAGNGNYYYIDNMNEARKVFVDEINGTLYTIAKDVKFQVEFNPAIVQSYRLIGYENRKLQDEDFNNDKIDAGELGAGHTVTALYEIIPVGVQSEFAVSIDNLKYQNEKVLIANSDELLNVKIRYKDPNGSASKLIESPLTNSPTEIGQTSNNFRFSAALVQFGMLMRDSEFKQGSSMSNAINMAEQSKGADAFGYRNELISLMKIYKQLSPETNTKTVQKDY